MIPGIEQVYRQSLVPVTRHANDAKGDRGVRSRNLLQLWALFLPFAENLCAAIVQRVGDRDGGHQLASVVVARVFKNLQARAMFDDTTAAHHRNVM